MWQGQWGGSVRGHLGLRGSPTVEFLPPAIWEEGGGTEGFTTLFTAPEHTSSLNEAAIVEKTPPVN